MRCLAAVATVLALSGLLPLSAMAGFCAARPCCRAHSHAGMAAMRTSPACCNETNCDTSANHAEATSAKSTAVQPQLIVTLATPSTIVVPAQWLAAGGPIDTGPRPVRQRLAALSILLI